MYYLIQWHFHTMQLYKQNFKKYFPQQYELNSGVDFTKSRKSKINHKCYRKCDFQAFDWLKFTLTTDLRLTTFCEIDHWSLELRPHNPLGLYLYKFVILQGKTPQALGPLFVNACDPSRKDPIGPWASICTNL